MFTPRAKGAGCRHLQRGRLRSRWMTSFKRSATTRRALTGTTKAVSDLTNAIVEPKFLQEIANPKGCIAKRSKVGKRKGKNAAR